MKTTIVLLVLFILTSNTFSQDWSKLPELPVWYELENTSFGKNMTYLPNFDTAHGGLNALIPYTSSNTPTIYNRYKGDTESMFNWGSGLLGTGGGASTMADFDGDGVLDFYQNGVIGFYKGKSNGVPPDTIGIRSYYFEVDKNNTTGKYYVSDYDTDGKQDVIISYGTPSKEKQLGSIIFGNADLSKMQVVALPHTNDAGFYQECIIDAYTNNGKARMITMTWDNNRSNSSLHLYEIRFITSGTTVKVEYQKLSSLFLSNENSESFLIGIKTFHLYNNTQHSLLFIATLYNLDNDAFEKLWFRSQGSPEFKIPVSIPDVNLPGWFTISISAKFDLCYGGNPRNNPNPIAKLPDNVMLTDGSGTRLLGVSSVGDINHDGLGDIAAYYSGIDGNAFRIYLGVVGTVGVQDNTETKLTINIPNPVQRKHPFEILIKSPSETPAQCELYDMRGKLIALVWQGELQSGTNNIGITVHRTEVSAGMYNLRITYGSQFTDKAIIIE